MEPFVGEIRLLAFGFVPVGWQLCDGTMLQISQFDTLYALITTTYGGDGQTTFAVPDLRGRVPLHQGAVGGTGASYALGQRGGEEKVVLTPAQLPDHSHPFMISTQMGDQADPTGRVMANPKEDCKIFHATEPTLPMAAMAQSVGGGSTHTNMQPYMAVNYVIATYGVYPSHS